MGWNAGFGVRFPLFGRRGFADARMHCVVQDRSDLCHIPVTVGLLFRAYDAKTVDHASDRR
jgi:hypothetical protein